MATATDSTVRDRLKDVRAQLAATRDQRKALRDERDSARDAFKGIDVQKLSDEGKNLMELPEFAAAEEAVKKLGEVDDKVNDLQLAER